MGGARTIRTSHPVTLHSDPRVKILVDNTVDTKHRRRIKPEEKAKVVASIWVEKYIQFLVALAVLPRKNLNNRMNGTGWISSFFYKFVFYTLVFKHSFFIHYFFICSFFIQLIFIRFMFFMDHFL